VILTRLPACPVRSYRSPGYPAKLDALAVPGMLVKHQPPAWLRHAEIVGAAGLFLAANATGCTKSKPPTLASQAATLAPNAPAIVAPIFEHGEGRAAEGCVVVASPVYLSEEEALRVIKEELAYSGVLLTQSNMELTSTEVPLSAVQRWDQQKGESVIEEPARRAALRVDGFNVNRRVAVMFASHRDYWGIDGPWQAQQTLVYTVDLKEVGRFIAKHVTGKPEGVYLGVFYDPAVKLDMQKVWQARERARPHDDLKCELNRTFTEVRKQTQLEAQRLLREQVRDFGDWLKAQGAI